MKTRLWTIVGYKDKKTNAQNVTTYNYITRIKVYDCKTEEEALRAARKLVKRKGYYVEEVIEYAVDNTQSELLRLLKKVARSK